ncbi:MAG: hydrogenase/urease maturation nickel metallochaperone HypA [Candidatus Methanodesulfokora sp.]
MGNVYFNHHLSQGGDCLHEWSLADAAVRSLLSFGEEKGLKKFIEIEISMGEIMEIDKDVFKEAFLMLSKGTILENANIIFSEEKALFKCNSCGRKWDMEEAEKIIEREVGVEEEGGEIESPLHFMPELACALMRCPDCGSRDISVESGRDLSIRRVVAE